MKFGRDGGGGRWSTVLVAVVATRWVPESRDPEAAARYVEVEIPFDAGKKDAGRKKAA